jgi:hypothetical protein
MARTTPQEFSGIPSLDDAKVATIREWYVGALGDSDKADDPADAEYDQGQADAYSDVLALLYGSRCSHCGATLVGEDCPNYGSGPEHAAVKP